MAWLVHRLRSGGIDPRRVKLAAHLGHQPAVIAGEHELGYVDPTVFKDPVALSSRLYQWGAEACCRAVLAVYSLSESRSPEDQFSAALARAWALCPCGLCQAAANTTYCAYEQSHTRLRKALGPGFLACRIAALGEENPRKGCDAESGVTLALASTCLVGEDWAARHQRMQDDTEVLDALRSSLIPWLIGAGDPLLEW